MKICKLNGCDSASVAKALCDKHYRRLRKYGDCETTAHMGQTKHLHYSRYRSMISRCEDPNHHAYANYGKRGIYVCKEWRDSFFTYVEDINSLINANANGYTVDRIHSNSGYSKENVRWASAYTQSSNRRTSMDNRWDDDNMSEMAEYISMHRLNKKQIAKMFNTSFIGANYILDKTNLRIK